MDQFTLSLTKLFERPKGRYPILSVRSMIKLRRDAPDQHPLVARSGVVAFLISRGGTKQDFNKMSDVKLTVALADALEGLCPKDGDVDVVSLALEAHKTRRDKDVAHSEAVDPSTLPGTTWRDSLALLRISKEILAVVGMGFLGISHMDNNKEYLMSMDAEQGAVALRRLLRQAGIKDNAKAV